MFLIFLKWNHFIINWYNTHHWFRRCCRYRSISTSSWDQMRIHVIVFKSLHVLELWLLSFAERPNSIWCTNDRTLHSTMMEWYRSIISFKWYTKKEKNLSKWQCLQLICSRFHVYTFCLLQIVGVAWHPGVTGPLMTKEVNTEGLLFVPKSCLLVAMFWHVWTSFKSYS